MEPVRFFQLLGKSLAGEGNSCLVVDMRILASPHQWTPPLQAARAVDRFRCISRHLQAVGKRQAVIKTSQWPLTARSSAHRSGWGSFELISCISDAVRCKCIQSRGLFCRFCCSVASLSHQAAWETSSDSCLDGLHRTRGLALETRSECTRRWRAVQ